MDKIQAALVMIGITLCSTVAGQQHPLHLPDSTHVLYVKHFPQSISVTDSMIVVSGVIHHEPTVITIKANMLNIQGNKEMALRWLIAYFNRHSL